MTRDWAYAAAALWGFAEATFFFIVPDVLLMFLATRLRRAFVASLWALAGALAGGAAMYVYGCHYAAVARMFLDGVPGIQTKLIEDVADRIAGQGSLAVMRGPLLGTPYKIYAVEWGAAGLPGELFLLISVPARYLRFFLSALFAAAVYRMAGRHARVLLAFGWLIFYGFYFYKFGW